MKEKQFNFNKILNTINTEIMVLEEPTDQKPKSLSLLFT